MTTFENRLQSVRALIKLPQELLEIINRILVLRLTLSRQASLEQGIISTRHRKPETQVVA